MISVKVDKIVGLYKSISEVDDWKALMIANDPAPKIFNSEESEPPRTRLDSGPAVDVLMKSWCHEDEYQHFSVFVSSKTLENDRKDVELYKTDRNL